MARESRDANREVLPDPEDAENEGASSAKVARDTVKPAFDVEEYAESVTGRERLSTIVDAEATEEARLASVLMDSTPPEPPTRRIDLDLDAPEVEVLLSDDEVIAEELEGEEEIAFLRARLAPMTRVPTLVRPITELGSVIEDPKTAYMLGFVDGLLPLDTLVEVAGLPEVEALRILDRAVDQYVLTFRRGDE
jgi:hypothetical protein